MLTEKIDGLASIFGTEDLEPDLLEHRRRHGPDHRFVIGYQHGAGPRPAHLVRRCGSAFSVGLVTGRQQDRESRALTGLAIHHDGAPVTPHDAHHRCESQSAPRELGGEERVEDAPLGRFVHAATGIGNLDADVFPFQQAFAQIGPRQVLPVTSPDEGADGYPAGSIGNCVGCVDNQVHHNLSHLRRVAFDCRQGLGQVAFQLGFL